MLGLLILEKRTGPWSKFRFFGSNWFQFWLATQADFSEFQKDELIGTPVSNLYFIPSKREILINKLMENGVIPDWREPNVIRCAPVPLYNSFEDVYRFGEILKSLL